MKTCFKCGVEKPLSEFYKHPQMADGHLNKCKECNKKDVRENRKDKKEYYDEYDRNRPNHLERGRKSAERVKRLYSTDDEFKARILTYRERWSEANQHKRKAHYAVSNALRDGKMVKGSFCESCGTTKETLQGHHWSYLEEHWLDVAWLCAKCHGLEHKRLNKICRDLEGELTEDDFKFKVSNCRFSN